ncbi:H/ACA ribonucleoprotein complex subunit GAR1-like [Canis lupus familiaris]|uniref:H/ACA ribonucleoprotein complex subunit GAR1-like n=1 Tax=Canis lupus familiaris TaxID=9615 RepID=UPI0018F7D4A3|nr:H/ACA ribonucleoprotein complex subunit GAR1-like [Canis lupus familiaris]
MPLAAHRPVRGREASAGARCVTRRGRKGRPGTSGDPGDPGTARGSLLCLSLRPRQGCLCPVPNPAWPLASRSLAPPDPDTVQAPFRASYGETPTQLLPPSRGPFPEGALSLRAMFLPPPPPPPRGSGSLAHSTRGDHPTGGGSRGGAGARRGQCRDGGRSLTGGLQGPGAVVRARSARVRLSRCDAEPRRPREAGGGRSR